MIYTKGKLKDGSVVCSPITSENTYTRCVRCGKEIQMDLRELILAEVEDPYGTGVNCTDCTDKMISANRSARPLVYICSPYSGDVDANIKAARKYCRYAVDNGYIPVAPHLLYPQFMDDNDPAERKLGLAFGNALMDQCRELWVCGDHLSAGMEAEFDRASAKGMAIKFIGEEDEDD